MRSLVTAAVVASALAAPGPALAQGGPGFLFDNPRVSLGFKAGYQMPQAGSAIYDFALDSLTLGRSDFDGPWIGGELAVRLTDHVDFAVGFGWSQSRAESEYVNWVDQDDRPIEQVTELETFSGSFGAKLYLTDRGRQVGRFAWVPSLVTPYVGGGIGWVSYEFVQGGDWVDFETLEIVTDRLESDGSGFSGHGAVGFEIALGRQFVLTGETRYTYAEGSVEGPYAAFGHIDLTGLQFLGGIALRF
jgi:hypothetical protein